MAAKVAINGFGRIGRLEWRMGVSEPGDWSSPIYGVQGGL